MLFGNPKRFQWHIHHCLKHFVNFQVNLANAMYVYFCHVWLFLKPNWYLSNIPFLFKKRISLSYINFLWFWKMLITVRSLLKKTHVLLCVLETPVLFSANWRMCPVKRTTWPGGVSNNRRIDCSSKSICRPTSIFILFLEGIPPATCGFPLQEASNEESASMSWSHPLHIRLKPPRMLPSYHGFQTLIWWYSVYRHHYDLHHFLPVSPGSLLITTKISRHLYKWRDLFIEGEWIMYQNIYTDKISSGPRHMFNTFRPQQNRQHSVGDMFKLMFLDGYCCIFIQNIRSLSLGVHCFRR